MFAAGMFHKFPQTYLFILNDGEKAGYFYHDLTQIIGTKDVLFFPSAYKRAAKYGQIDPANEILRTEVLNRLQSKKFPVVLVSYPDALAEKTVSKDIFQKTPSACRSENKSIAHLLHRYWNHTGFNMWIMFMNRGNMPYEEAF